MGRRWMGELVGKKQEGQDGTDREDWVRGSGVRETSGQHQTLKLGPGVHLFAPGLSAWCKSRLKIDHKIYSLLMILVSRPFLFFFFFTVPACQDVERANVNQGLHGNRGGFGFRESSSPSQLRGENHPLQTHTPTRRRPI